MTLSITAITSDRHRGPWCCARVYVSNSIYTGTQLRRVNMTAAKGIDRDQCGAPAVFLFNEQMLCQRHAGDMALDILLDEPTAHRRKRDWIII